MKLFLFDGDSFIIIESILVRTKVILSHPNDKIPLFKCCFFYVVFLNMIIESHLIKKILNSFMLFGFNSFNKHL